MRIVYDPTHQRHRPKTDILYGTPAPHPDLPDRVEAIRATLARSRWKALLTAPRVHDRSLAAGVHEAAYVSHLEQCARKAGECGPDGEWFPYVWPHDRAMDTGTPVRMDTVELAWAAACVALTGADLLLEGERNVYALCRPPGHHAGPGYMGGYCYFNNAALAANRLLRAGQGSRRVAILDLDLHHGNGTQEIFYATDQVLYCSIHGGPEWAYPPHTGFPAEKGAGAGLGFTYNQPLPQGANWSHYAVPLERALERIAKFEPAELVLSQGFDTHEGDRWGGFLLRAEHYALCGERLRQLGIPVLVVLEGGYEPPNLAAGSLALLDGLAGS